MSDDTPARRGASAPTSVGAGPAAVRSSAAEIDAFVAAARDTAPDPNRARLIFALDATMSRQPTWDRAASLQAEMFAEAGRIAGLDVQLVYFRGHDECRASRFVPDAARLARLMEGIDCRGGRTQIGKVLRHAARTAREGRVAALVYVGDAMEESVDDLAAAAGDLGVLGTPVFLFREGSDRAAARAFEEIARLSRGAHLAFSEGSAAELGALLRAVAAYAAGGLGALQALAGRDAGARALIGAMRR
ncbi:VWA domain-containing protein [Oharaeibacter diazotrophicus]|uniref:VWA domain-containing protein n=1 Tax=Oharaeibacter diazotrophicus TaxID=1920512 RepID=A0A4R6RIZ9_9HYPH|nr:VWA domain-containing protein [Oharaeibacter diazotrophicus]TDP86473.1 hypothetical protein EDD54_0348 [Oharaeibacter diazotrophicus]BBE71585.1 hypothetical protein OHA_1_01163 [Pleomorphomonas sp. SM30]GLS78346.1 hypothetical protein GCM10007904_36830 [Oharaeibacter diazotrophicus]